MLTVNDLNPTYFEVTNLEMFLKFIILSIINCKSLYASTKVTEIYGPGLVPHEIIMPARYFFIKVFYTGNNSAIIPDEVEEVKIDGVTNGNRPCRIWTNILNRNDGLQIVRYKVYEKCLDFEISIKFRDERLQGAVYKIPQAVYPDLCDCSRGNIDNFLDTWKCGPVPGQIEKDFREFPKIDWNLLRSDVISKYNLPHSVSLCHYVIKDNQIYRRCYGEHVGFNMFMDNILLSLTRKISLPDLEFFVNLGDWPLVKTETVPIFSWCGSHDTQDIVMPTYDITESTLENMGRVTLDMLSVQGNSLEQWDDRIPKAFWRGRDSNQHRLDLIDVARENPDLFNASLTNFFFFRDKQDKYGPKSEHVSFFEFFKYKYQLALDGTVAAYRFPYLLAGGSLVFKQDSKYYEHFYSDLVAHEHYIPIKKDLSNILEVLREAIRDDKKSQEIAKNARNYANENLLPQNIFCYHAHLLNELNKRISSRINVLEQMELVQSSKEPDWCDECKRIKHVEL